MQVPDWLTWRKYPPKFRFFNSHDLHQMPQTLNSRRVIRENRVIRAASFARIAPQDCLSRLCIDLTCKSFVRNAPFASGAEEITRPPQEMTS